MQLSETSKLYNENYFASGCGREYKRDEHWLHFFDGIAARIASSIQPRTMLDAGCAMGFLVEQMRTRGVEAWGIDISEYAIQNAHESIKDFVWVGSITDPFPRKYDLIVTIEVLEHVPKESSEQALINLCQHTDDIIFSSTPLDYKETTHFNVQPVEYWAELFAQQGFYRDVDFDATFITPWAARYRRKQEPLPRLVRDYERWVWATRKENADLRQQAIEDKESIHIKRNEARQLRAMLHDLEAQLEIWLEKKESVEWKLLLLFRKFRKWLIPPNSLRERFLRAVFVALRVLKNEGAQLFNRKGIHRILAGSRAKYQRAYDKWITKNTLTAEEIVQQRKEAMALEDRPLISIITPVYNPPIDVLRATIDSVLEQTYPNWELCLVDGNSDQTGVKELIAEYEKRDSRIRLKSLSQNLGISGNSNEAFQMAQGMFVQLLDHDDVLAPNALFEIAKHLNENPATDILYFDDDKLSADGMKRRDPLFKPDWSPVMLLSGNYLSHPAIRRSIVLDVGMFDTRMDGAQDWDLVLRISERTRNIAHIPKVLYHWRQIDSSTSVNMGVKPGVFEAQLRSVENHLHRVGLTGARVVTIPPGFLRIYWPVKGGKVSVILYSQGQGKFLQKCVSSILQGTFYSNYEIIILVDSEVQTELGRHFYTLQQDPRVKFVETNPFLSYSASNNIGVQHASGEILLFLNAATETFEPDWMEEIIRWTEWPEIGVVGAKLLFPNKTICHAGIVIDATTRQAHYVFQGLFDKAGGLFGNPEWYRNYSAVSGACMMMRREVYEALNGFDENNDPDLSDVAFCIQAAQQGYQTLYTPFAQLRYTGFPGRQFGSRKIPIEAKLYNDWFELGDPFFNPNLFCNRGVPALSLKNRKIREE